MKQDVQTSKVSITKDFQDLLFNFQGSALKRAERNRSSKRYGGIAQLGEHLLCKQGVCGSIPHISTIGLRIEPKTNMGL